MRKGHRPERSCVICRMRAGKELLTRFVVAGDAIRHDPRQVMPGRGMYVCGAERCRTAFVRSKRYGARLAPDVQATMNGK